MIVIVYSDCHIGNNTAERYGGLLFIERNNVKIDFINTQITDNQANKHGSIIYWLCQINTNRYHSNLNTSLCGELYIFESSIKLLHAATQNAFQIDLSADPNSLYFRLHIEDSSFSTSPNRNMPAGGTIFDFNNDENELHT